MSELEKIFGFYFGEEARISRREFLDCLGDNQQVLTTASNDDLIRIFQVAMDHVNHIEYSVVRFAKGIAPFEKFEPQSD